LGKKNTGIFLQRGLDRQMGDLPVGQVGTNFLEPFSSRVHDQVTELELRNKQRRRDFMSQKARQLRVDPTVSFA
jgi:hypothetical protein